MSASSLLCFALLCITFLAASFAEEGNAEPPYKCYVCNETIVHGYEGDIKCLDEAFDPETGENKHLEPEQCPWDNHTACAKTYLANYDVIEGKTVLVTRIMRRECATVEENELGCTYDKGSAGFARRCYCQGDNCNSASIAHLSISFLALLISFVFLTTRI